MQCILVSLIVCCESLLARPCWLSTDYHWAFICSQCNIWNSSLRLLHRMFHSIVTESCDDFPIIHVHSIQCFCFYLCYRSWHFTLHCITKCNKYWLLTETSVACLLYRLVPYKLTVKWRSRKLTIIQSSMLIGRTSSAKCSRCLGIKLWSRMLLQKVR